MTSMLRQGDNIQQLTDLKNNRFMNNIILKVILILFFLTSMNIVASATDPSYTEADCRNCHGYVGDRHHMLVARGEKVCTDCHIMKYDNQTHMYYPEVIRDCLVCHPIQNHVDCVTCHTPEDVNISLFGRHSNINTSDGDNNVTNNDCWTCHYNKNMNTSNVYLCESCHENSSGIVQITDPTLIKSEFTHGMTSCKDCHAPIKYHNNGTTGPLGIVESILRKIN